MDMQSESQKGYKLLEEDIPTRMQQKWKAKSYGECTKDKKKELHPENRLQDEGYS